MAKIALSLSGGGYRAATFHLGTLSYLNHLTAADGTPLLDHVMAVSTISGGSLTGLWFILGKCRGWSNEKIISSLYEKLLTGRIIDRASLEFFNSKNNNHSLIREMVRIYDEEIFEGATLGDLMEAIDNISIDHFSANATEFNNATEFRFQVGKRLITEKGGTSQGVIGNAFYKIPQAIAAQIHLAEVFAASSCFPGGFEPLFFPRDFKLSNNADNRQYVESVAPLALMDGGVVDNQGIEPICLLRKRTDIDLFIISDAGCGQEKPFTFEENHSTSFLTMHHVNMGLNLAIIAMAQFLAWVPRGFWFGLCLGVTLVFLALRITTAVASRLLLKSYSKKIPFSFNWKQLLHIPLSKYADMILSRAKSMLTLTNKVFMRHIRSLNYATVYEDEQWQNRRIMNALYELCTDKDWDNHLTADEKQIMSPGSAVNQCSDVAASMGTTLWWSEDDRKAGKPEALFAAGQYNICWNLLEFIYRLRRNSDNVGDGITDITSLQSKLEADWQRFKENPKWMIPENNK